MATVRDAKKLWTKLSWDEDFQRHYTSAYQVIASYDANPVDVANATGIPTYGTFYTWDNVFDLFAWCRSVDVQPGTRLEGDLMDWTCTLRHSSKPSEGSNDMTTAREVPTDEPAVVSGSFSPYRRIAETDKDGNPIQNTAGFPYEPAVTVDGNYLVLRISFNTATLSLATWAAYGAGDGGVVNSDTIWGLSARRVKLRKWGFRVLYTTAGQPYVKNDQEFLISYKQHPASPCVGPSNAVGWYTTVPNIGPGYFENGDFTQDKFVTFKDREENPVDLGKLACNGDILSPSSNPKYNVFAVEPELPFGSITPSPLPGPFV